MPDCFDALLTEIRNCRVCAEALPHTPRPIVRLGPDARVLIVGQAPGTRVHATGIPWNDPSGDRLRDWMGLDRDAFYDSGRIAIAPMGLCFPGLDARGADLPPRRECAPLWQQRIAEALPAIRLTLLIGQYAQRFHLGAAAKGGVTATVQRWRDLPPHVLPLPHPSWRNTGWLKRHPWFEAELVPELRRRLVAAFS